MAGKCTDRCARVFNRIDDVEVGLAEDREQQDAVPGWEGNDAWDLASHGGSQRKTDDRAIELQTKVASLQGKLDEAWEANRMLADELKSQQLLLSRASGQTSLLSARVAPLEQLLPATRNSQGDDAPLVRAEASEMRPPGILEGFVVRGPRAPRCARSRRSP